MRPPERRNEARSYTCLLLWVQIALCVGTTWANTSAQGFDEPWIEDLMAARKPLTPLTSPPMEQATRGAAVIYSALRDPIDKKVRILLDSQDWMVHRLECHFFVGGSQPPLSEHAEGEVAAETSRSAIYDQPRLFNGWMIECADPGPEYHEVLLRLHDVYAMDLLVAQVKITVVDTKLHSDLGICLSSIYSQNSGLEPWVEENMRLGVGLIHVYYVHKAIESEMQGLQDFMGVTSRKSSWERFSPPPLPTVRYYGYAPPLHAYLFSQRTMFNDCLYRTKHMHNYVIVMDSDEFLATMTGAPKNLPQLIRQQLKNDSASLAFTRLYYPFCQIPAKYGGKLPKNISITEEAVYFKNKFIFWNQPKYVYVPSRVHSVHQHGVLTAKSGYRCLDIARPETLFVKHVRRASAKDWSCPKGDEKWSGFIMDTDVGAFQNFIDSELGPIGQERWPTWVWWSQDGCNHQ